MIRKENESTFFYRELPRVLLRTFHSTLAIIILGIRMEPNSIFLSTARLKDTLR